MDRCLAVAPLRLSPHAAPRDALHSLPTRRSSDLADVDDSRLLQPVVHLHELLQIDLPVAAAVHELIGAGEHHLTHTLGEEVEADRKSTRLNCSHLVISYDVFCLKKKMGLEAAQLA